MNEVSPVFTDYATITTPPEHLDDVLNSIKPWLDAALCYFDIKSNPDVMRYRSPSGGLFTVKAKSYGVSIYTASGRFMSDLRQSGVQAAFLAAFSAFPHNVSSADFTVDEYRDDVPSRLVDIYEQAAGGLVSFTRKHVGRSAIRRLFRPAAYDDTQETGTVYIGKRGSHEVHCKCYDKRDEIMYREGGDSRNALRHEITVSGKMGLTLRDLDQPHDCFYHFYPSNLLTTAQKAVWHGHGEGFAVKRPEKRLASQILASKVETSMELASMLRLADEVGQHGLDYFIRLLRERHNRLHSSSLAA